MLIRTDLALEAKEMYKDEAKEIPGISSDTKKIDDVLITKVVVENENGAKKILKPIGTYITLESPKIKNLDPEASEQISYILRDQLKELINVKKDDTVLVVGLGNWNITPDALGPKVVSEIMVTRHLFEHIPDQIDENIRSVSAVSPGVLGITGVETSDIIMGIINKVKPTYVIAIDALASKSPQRISTTIQITDTGINPGSGVGNKRQGLNKETLGIPVIAIGVPTVVDAVSIAADLIDELFKNILENSEKNSEVYSVVNHLRNSGQDNLMRVVIDDEKKELMVTPKEVDSIISHISKVISNGINLAIHDDMDLEYIESFTF